MQAPIQPVANRPTLVLERPSDGARLSLDSDEPWTQTRVDKALALSQVQRFLSGKAVFQDQLSNELKALAKERGTFRGAFVKEIEISDRVEGLD